MDLMSVEYIGDEIINVVFRGRLDSVGAASVGQRFNALVGARRAVMVDLSDVDYIASLAIRFLVTGAKAVKNNSGKLVILSPQEYVHDVLKTAGIDLLIPVLFDRTAALAAVQPDGTDIQPAPAQHRD
jgi:anti-anti-sigma factor